MALRRSIAALGMLALIHAGPAPAQDREIDADRVERDQERGERDAIRAAERAAERAEEQAARYSDESDRIEDRAMEDRADLDADAAEDRADLDADAAEDRARDAEEAVRDAEDLAEDRADAQDDAAEDAAEQAQDAAEEAAEAAEEAAEDAAEEAADAIEDAADHSGHRDWTGSSAMMRDLGASEMAEHDERGFPVRRGEVVAMDLAPATLRAVEARGFRVIGRQQLPSLHRELVRLETPDKMDAVAARELIRTIDPDAVVDLVHYYGLNLAAGSRAKPVKAGTRPARQQTAMVVGVIDTAISAHQTLGAARLIPWADGDLPQAPSEHGTAVASILADQGQATIYSANIFRGPPGRPFTSAEVIAGALEWMLSHDIPTINMSLAGPRNAILDRLVRDALAQGRSLVAAAGNGGPSAPPAYPAAVPGVIAVTAVDAKLKVYRYANRGRYITVAAPGVGVLAAFTKGGLARFSGTSYAAPHISGWIARCRASGDNAGRCHARLREAAHDLGVKGFDEVYGFGYVR